MILTVITINYNNAAGLEKTIKSVLSQTWKEFEYIVIDGGSTDGSKEVIELYADKITYWVSEPDKGIYNAMNKGIKQAKGEYLQFLNSADIYADENVLGKVFKNNTYTDSILRGIQICDYEPIFRRFNHGDKTLNLYDIYSDALQHQATFIKRNLFDKYGLYDEKYKAISDWKFFMQAILGDETSLFLNFDIIIFDMSGISTNPQLISLMLNEREQMLSELLPQNLRQSLEEHDILMKSKHKVEFYDRYERDMYLPPFVSEHPFARFCIRGIVRFYKLAAYLKNLFVKK